MSNLRIIAKYEATGSGFGLEDDSGHICTFEDAPEAEAYVSLFAAAPAMLEALREIEVAGLGGYLTPELCADIVMKAIAKAEGR